MNQQRLVTLVLGLGLFSLGALAGDRSSAKYRVPADTVDTGGGKSSTDRLTNYGTLGGINGTSSSTAKSIKVWHGYIAQWDVAAPIGASNADVAVTVAQNTSIPATDSSTIEGKIILVNVGVTLTLAGTHRVAALKIKGTVTHNGGDTNGLNLMVDGLLEISASGAIDVSSRGYWGGYRDGNGDTRGETRGTGGVATSVGGAANGAGGSYGSLGVGGTPNALYGSEVEPVDLGSGGASDGSGRGAQGGNGGGRIELRAGSLLVNGSLLADGGNASTSGCGDGSGGAIYVIVNGGTFSGAGLIRAAGGTAGNAGGGGRIAIVGFGANHFTRALGGQGTLYLKPGGPVDTNSALKLSLNIHQGACSLSFDSVATNYYQLQRTEVLTLPQWEAVGARVPGDGEKITIADPTDFKTQPSRYYRLILVP